MGDEKLDLLNKLIEIKQGELEKLEYAVRKRKAEIHRANWKPNPAQEARYRHLREQRDAWAAVKRLRESGELPNPHDVPCENCGDIGNGKRHDHHHPNGYSGNNAKSVVVLCASCHVRLHANERARKKKEMANG